MGDEGVPSSESSTDEEFQPRSPVVLTPAEQAEVEQSEQHNESLLTDVSSDYTTSTVTSTYWNVQPASSVAAITKRYCILEILTLLNVDIYALQELPWVPQNFVRQITGVATEEERPYFIRPYEVLGHTKEAVIYYNNEVFVAVEEVFENDVLPVAADRVVVAKMTVRNTTNSFYFASVHLPYITGGTVHSRTATAIQLLKTLRDYAENNSLPLFVAGDFNISGLGNIEPPERVSTSGLIGDGVDRHFWCGIDNVDTKSDFDVFEKDTTGAYLNFSAAASERLRTAGLTVEAIKDAYVRGGSHRPVKCTISLSI